MKGRLVNILQTVGCIVELDQLTSMQADFMCLLQPEEVTDRLTDRDVTQTNKQGAGVLMWGGY